MATQGHVKLLVQTAGTLICLQTYEDEEAQGAKEVGEPGLDWPAGVETASFGRQGCIAKAEHSALQRRRKLDGSKREERSICLLVSAAAQTGVAFRAVLPQHQRVVLRESRYLIQLHASTCATQSRSNQVQL